MGANLVRAAFADPQLNSLQRDIIIAVVYLAGYWPASRDAYSASPGEVRPQAGSPGTSLAGNMPASSPVVA